MSKLIENYIKRLLNEMKRVDIDISNPESYELYDTTDVKIKTFDYDESNKLFTATGKYNDVFFLN